MTRKDFSRSLFLASLSAFALKPARRAFALCAAASPYPSWNELVDYARWCPSVHNLQPHRLKMISETEADLYYDPSRLLPVGDPKCIFSTVALGIFIENLSVAAAHSGKSVETLVFNRVTIGGYGPQLFARLKMVPGGNEKLSRDLILARKTSRLHYDGRPLADPVIQQVQVEANRFGHSLYTSHDPALIDEMISLNQETLFSDLVSKADREELDHLFRYSKKEAEEHKDGLWSKCMGFPGALLKSVFRHHKRWEKGRKKHWLEKLYKSSFNGTATLCWITGAFDSPADWLNAGRMLARIWLTFTEQGAFIQPFGSLITNPAAYLKIQEKFLKPAGQNIWFVMRCGYCPEPARSFRLETNQIMMD